MPLAYLKGFPALVVQFSHLLLDPCRNVRDGHMDDILQEDGKVLEQQQELKSNQKQATLLQNIRGMYLELNLAQHHLGFLSLIGVTSLSGQD